MQENSVKHKCDASRLIWNWQEDPFRKKQINANKLRLKGIVQSICMVVVAILFFYFNHRVMAFSILVLSTIIGLSALFSPSGIFLFLDKGAKKIGVLLSTMIKWVLLPLIYYGFFVPFGKCCRKGNRDKMKRYYEVEAASYWIGPSELPAENNREKQF